MAHTHDVDLYWNERCQLLHNFLMSFMNAVYTHSPRVVCVRISNTNFSKTRRLTWLISQPVGGAEYSSSGRHGEYCAHFLCSDLGTPSGGAWCLSGSSPRPSPPVLAASDQCSRYHGHVHATYATKTRRVTVVRMHPVVTHERRVLTLSVF